MARSIHHWLTILMLTAAATPGIPAVASAQPPPTLSAAIARLSPGETIWVTTADGRERHGTLTRIADDAIAIDDGRGTTVLSRAAIARIQTTDGIGDGILRGAVIGALAGGVSAGVFMANYGECPCEGTVNFVVAFSAMGLGIGTAAGALGDALFARRVTIYGAPVKVSLAPSAAPGALGFHGAIRW